VLSEAKTPKISKKIIDELLLQYKNLQINEKKFEFSIVHGDLSFGNLLWKNEELFILDFDETTVAPREYEIISTIIKTCFTYDDFDVNFAVVLLSKYLSFNDTTFSKLEKIGISIF